MDPRRIRIVFRTATRDDAGDIHALLAEAFEPYRGDYTVEAYEATVVPVDEIERRIDDPDTEVLIAVWAGKVFGSVTVTPLDRESIYIKSMAVASGFQGRGIAYELLKRIEQTAISGGHTKLVLDCYEPLTKAIALYERFGFRRTGKNNPYHGIVVFEMTKKIGHERA